MLPAGMISGSHSLPSTSVSSALSDGASSDVLDLQTLQFNWFMALFAGVGLLGSGNTTIAPADATNSAASNENVPSHKAKNEDGSHLANIAPPLANGEQNSLALQTQGIDDQQNLTGNVGNDGNTLVELLQHRVPAKQNGKPPNMPVNAAVDEQSSLPGNLESQETVSPANSAPSENRFTIALPTPANSLSPAAASQDGMDGPEAELPSGNASSSLTVPLMDNKVAQIMTNVAEAGTALTPGGNEHSQNKNGDLDTAKDSAPNISVSVHGVSAGESRPAPATDVAAQISKEMTTHLQGLGQQGRTDFHFHLDPPDLGPVRIHLTANDGVVSARLVVREESARQILESQMNTLVQRLTDAGISLGRFDVSRDGAGLFQQWQEAAPQNTSRDQDANPAPAFAASPSAGRRGIIDLVA